MKVDFEDLEDTPYEWVQKVICFNNLENERKNKEYKKQESRSRLKNG